LDPQPPKPVVCQLGSGARLFSWTASELIKLHLHLFTYLSKRKLLPWQKTPCHFSAPPGPCFQQKPGAQDAAPTVVTRPCPGGSRSDSSTNVTAKAPSHCARVRNSSLHVCFHVLSLSPLEFKGGGGGRSINPTGINPVWLCRALPSYFPHLLLPCLLSSSRLFSLSHPPAEMSCRGGD